LLALSRHKSGQIMDEELVVESVKTEPNENNISTRPVLVSVICLFGIALAGGNVIFRSYGILFEPKEEWLVFDYFAILSSIFDLICFFLILELKKVGVCLYIASVVFAHLLLLYFSMFNIIGLAFQILIVFYFLVASKKWKTA
jgi:hypothetical protein